MHRNPRLNRDGDFIFAGSVIVHLHGCVGGEDVGCERVCGKRARVRFSFSGSVAVFHFCLSDSAVSSSVTVHDW